MNPQTATSASRDSADTIRTSARPEWTPADAAELYGVDNWGGGYFGVSDRGTLVAYPDTIPEAGIDLYDVALGLASREIGSPVIVRLPGVLQHRMQDLRRAFDDAIAALDYRAGYSCVYPIKVNQERHVCEAVRDFGAELGFGLEVGSKPELIAGLALTRGFDEMPLVCNGFKDAEYIETVVLAAKMGRNMLPVAEQAYELRLIRDAALAHNVRPGFGIRAKLAAPGVGRWAGSSGIRGKFGLTVGEILHAVEYLKEVDLLDGFRMLHCHVGSQIFDIRAVKYTVSELAHLYVELVRAGAPIEILDLGGGLGVDYDGSQSATDSSVNYTLDQYASDVVHRIKTVCDEAGVDHPTIMTESGRALVAHSSVLITDVIGARSFRVEPDQDLVQRSLAVDEPPQPLLDVHEAYERRNSGPDEMLEVYADAEHALSEAIHLFNLGYMDLRTRAACEELFWAVGSAALETYGDDLPESLSHLPDRLADLYFVNVSVFQSLLDSWGIDQVFPIMPIHRLDEEPTRRGILADITCDSDGRVDRFPGEGGHKTTLELHDVPPPGADVAGQEPYYLGIFLTGAYQETLGDLHNLLGDTNAVHVRRGANGRWRIEAVVEGETVRDVLSYVQFEPEEMRRQLRLDVEAAIEVDRLTPAEGASLRRFLDEGLQGYTYLE
jgi:arginine decarboxylase